MHNELVFVYGTLKRGHYNHGWLKGSLFVKNATTTNDYLLYNLGSFPGMIKSPKGKGKCVKGEIFKVTDSVLRDLDMLEGVDVDFYERVRISLLDTQEPVWGYLYCKDVSSFQEIGEAW